MHEAALCDFLPAESLHSHLPLHNPYLLGRILQNHYTVTNGPAASGSAQVIQTQENESFKNLFSCVFLHFYWNRDSLGLHRSHVDHVVCFYLCDDGE